MLMYQISLEKGFFPYFYWGNFEKLKEGLPKEDKFYNTLTSCTISDKNYQHILNVWKAFKMNNMKDYHDIYLMFDVLLLASVFESFRENP